MPEQPSDRCQFEVTLPRYGGLFDLETGGSMPYVLPGEIVAIPSSSQVGQLEGNASIQIKRVAPQRVVPGCVHFGTCGGCHYQHITYSAQVELKRDILGRLLTEAGLSELPQIRCHAAEPWVYRNRIRIRVQADGADLSGSFRAGYSRQGSNEFLPIRMCPVSAPLLWRAVETLLLLAASNSLARLWLRATSELELFCNPDESRLQLSFFLRDVEPAHRDPSSFRNFFEHIRAQLPELAGAGAQPHFQLNRRERRTWNGASCGEGALAYPADGRSYWVSRGAFFQVNRFLVDRLVALVTENEHGLLAWDLFAGVGLLARALAGKFQSVVAVEGGKHAAGDLVRASHGQLLYKAECSSALDFLRAQELQRDRPDLIVLDPPRAGLGPEGCAILARFAASRTQGLRIVYVSCDPTTLARDLAILTRTAYRIDTLDMIDLFPQTYHMETVVHLSRA